MFNKFTTDALFVENKQRKNILVNTDHGLMIVNRFDYDSKKDGQGAWLLDHGNVCTVEASYVFKNINITNPIVFDIGANIGTFATWVAKGYPLGQTYCFEPQRQIFQILCGNIAINNITNVFTYNCAIGDKTTTIEINELDYNIPNNFGSFSLLEKYPNYNNSYVLDQYALDDFIVKYKISKVDFIKIDCEGMDLKVLLGANNILNNFKPFILVEYFDDRRNQLNEIIGYLEKFKYKLIVLDKFSIFAEPLV